MPRGGYVSWFYIYMYILYNDLMRGHVDLVMLRSTTGSYGRPVIEVTYGEILFHSTEAVWELVVREEWLGWQTRVNTSVGSVYIILWFLWYKNLYTYYVLKTYIYYKRTLVVSDLVLAR